MQKFKKFLVTMKVFDSDQTLSLTSLLMLVLIVKIAVVKDLDWMAVSALFLALCNYSAKKVIRLQDKKQTAEVDDQLTATLAAHAAQITVVTDQVSKIVSAQQVNSVMSQMIGR